ncbi:MAG: hypothetical protein AB2A00_40335 [Myxococcota bacterium]
MAQNRKPIRWDDTAARHDPQSLPFWRFYQEHQMQVAHRPRARGALSWLMPWRNG